MNIIGVKAEGIFIQAKSDQAVEQIQKFTHAMYGVSVGPAIALSKVFDFSKHKRMMDIGGGSGVYGIQVVKDNPNMSAIVLDLKSVRQVVDQYIEEFDLQEKINTKPLDFFKEELPKDCDIAFLSLIIHDYNEEKDRFLLKKVYDSLPNENGAIIISEWLLNDEKTGPIPAALMSLNLIILTSGGRNYSFVEISRMLSDVGFKNIEKRPLAGPAQIVIGYKNKKK
jgi:3-hydroxy-5-methyl-1-naphthoate 3-O-methyltransferase